VYASAIIRFSQLDRSCAPDCGRCMQRFLFGPGSPAVTRVSVIGPETGQSAPQRQMSAVIAGCQSLRPHFGADGPQKGGTEKIS